MTRDLSYLSKYEATVADSGAVPGGLQFPRISCGSERFTAIDAEGNDIFLSVESIDFVYIDANPHLSKVFYASGFDASNPTPPDCYSDNGFSPDIRVFDPKSHYCHECPKNAWGSAVSAMSGKNIKACGDYKKLAVYLVHNDAEGVYQFRIPSASTRNWGNYVNELLRFPTGGTWKLKPHMVLTRAKWSKASKNVLEFERIDFLDEDWMEVIAEHQNLREFEDWLGLDNQSQSKRQLESQKLKSAPQIEHKLAAREEQRIIDVEPEKARPMPSRKAPTNGAPEKVVAMKKPAPKPQDEPQQETPMERARRRAQERIAAEKV